MEDFNVINFSSSVQNTDYYNNISISKFTNSIELGISTIGAVTENVTSIVQLITKNILTKKGSNLFYPTIGCNLLTNLGKAVTKTLLQEIELDLLTLIENLNVQIRNYQDFYNIAEEERITNLYLAKCEYDVPSTSLEVNIKIIINNGEVIPLSFLVGL